MYVMERDLCLEMKFMHVYQHIQAEGDFIQYSQRPCVCTVRAHMKMYVESSTCDMMLAPKISLVCTCWGSDYEC